MAEENGLKDIEMVSLAVQIEGIAYFVNLGQEELKVLVRLAAGMRVPPELKVVKAPEGFALMDIKDMV